MVLLYEPTIGFLKVGKKERQIALSLRQIELVREVVLA